jgi:GT2 family glycosyltransferase
MPKASIIVVSYNSLHETTAPCLKSVFDKTTFPEYEVVVVDNHSTDGTPEFLAGLAMREPRLKVLLNSTNRGFAGGNNDGIRAAGGDILVLLNSDTLVTEGWLEGLAGFLEHHPSAGLVGPVSNAVGNEQRIHTGRRNPSEILEEGATWASRSRGDFFETERLGFFCVAARNRVIEEVGLLDEGFGQGLFEDDDYCIRVRRAGYGLFCREDVFIYHLGSAGFGKTPADTKALVKRNKALLERKFGIRYRPPHPRDRQLDLAESYLSRMGDGSDVAHLAYKIGNRLHAAEESMPRGWIKRYRFRRRIRNIRSALDRFGPTEHVAREEER